MVRNERFFSNRNRNRELNTGPITALNSGSTFDFHFHPTVRTEAAPRLRAVLMDAEAIRQSSVFSARMATSRCGEIKTTLGHDLNPSRSFIEFLLHNSHLMNEVGPTLCSTRLCVVWSGSGTAPQDLDRNMSALKVLW